MLELEKNPVIAAVSSEQELEVALKSGAGVIFMLRANILTLQKCVESASQKRKKLFVHADMTEGIAKDEFGIAYIAQSGADGIISTRANLIKASKKAGLMTVQRFFVIDARSVETALESVKNCKPDLIEIMPGVVSKVVARFKENGNIPVILGGFIETKQEIISALSAGAIAVSTSKQALWDKI